jgi:hypothetical protein
LIALLPASGFLSNPKYKKMPQELTSEDPVPQLIGRPRKSLTDGQKDALLEHIATGGGVVKWGKDNGFAYTTLCRILDEDEEFSKLYARAYEDQADFIVDEAKDIADDAQRDYSEDGEYRREHVQRSKLKVDTRIWIASRRKSRRYGSKIEHSGENGGAIKFVLSKEELDI